MCAVTELIRQRVLTLLIFIRDLMEDVQSLIDTAGDTEAEIWDLQTYRHVNNHL